LRLFRCVALRCARYLTATPATYQPFTAQDERTDSNDIAMHDTFMPAALSVPSSAASVSPERPVPVVLLGVQAALPERAALS
jgi:hypothetical protein